jgi:phenylpyruvate tautomerase PptA (4-oxalocrotonate tautomerase family)
MPLVKIEIESGKSLEYKQKLKDIIHQNLVTFFRIPDHDRRNRIYELSPENFEKAGRSSDYVIIEITVFKGRSLDTKRKFYRALNDQLVDELTIPPQDITIVLNEVPLENWGIRGGFPASELNLGFNLNV